MRRLVMIGMAAALVLFMGASAVLYQKYQRTSNDLTSAKTDEETTRSRYAEAIGSIAAIQDSLNAIVLGDESVPLAPNGYQQERALTGPHGDEVLDRISLLKAGIQRSKDKIQALDEHLKKSGLKIAGLERMVANLRHTLKEKETMVAQLSGQVDSLQTQVTGLATVVEEKRRELGTVYYMIGTKKDLTTSGVVVAKGGVLGIGKTLEPSRQINEQLFTAMDTDEQTTVDIPAQKAQVITAQPASSYALESDGNHLVLRILDPQEFRKVKHLVIMTT